MKTKSDRAIARLLNLPTEELTKFKRKLLDRYTVVDGCWNYAGTIDGRGYGRIQAKHADNKWSTVRTHRIAWALAHNQEIPKGLVVCHRCDNPACINPAHLFIGTQQDNVSDMLAKDRANFTKQLENLAAGRAKRASMTAAECRPFTTRQTRLTLAEVQQIRSRSVKTKELVQRLGVSAGYISKIRTGAALKSFKQ
jgi:hypothetical protein